MHEKPKSVIGNGEQLIDFAKVRRYAPKIFVAAGFAGTLAYLGPKTVDFGLSLGEGHDDATTELAVGLTVPDCGEDYNMLPTQDGGCIVVGGSDTGTDIDFEAIDAKISEGAESIADAAIQDLPDNNEFIRDFLADRERYNQPRERVEAPIRPVFSEGFFFNEKGEPRNITFAAFFAGAIGITAAGILLIRSRQTAVVGANGKKMPVLDVDPGTGEVKSNRVRRQSRRAMRDRHNAIKEYARETGQRVPR